MKGVESAHKKFGRLPWKTLFEPSIWVAERGMPLSETDAHHFEVRAPDLNRLAATRAILLKPDGSPYRAGEVFRQPALAVTLRAIARDGADYMYRGPWGDRLVAAVAADGGRMTKEDLADYQPIWADPIVVKVGAVELASLPLPNEGGVALVEAQQLALAAGLGTGGHWSSSAEVFRRAAAIGAAGMIGYLPEAVRAKRFPGVSGDPAARLTAANAAAFWSLLARGEFPIPFAAPPPKHSDDVVVIDAEGNMAAITHSINCVFWGKTAINIDGISIGDPASYQQALVAKTGPGNRLPDPTETGLVLEGGKPILAFASMGSGLHQRTFQGLANVLLYGMTVDQAIDSPDPFLPSFDAALGMMVQPVPEGRFPAAVLEGSGIRVQEVSKEQMRLSGEGVWVAISRDRKTGALRAASNNRNNSIALAY
jgi:gamma-glutamyltranspeptidase/glutathione hydrolase